MKQELYKGFKKVAEDEKAAIMAHENGHRLRIVKAQLSPKLRDQLTALPLYQNDPEDEIPSPSEESDDSKPNATDAKTGQSVSLPADAPQTPNININVGSPNQTPVAPPVPAPPEQPPAPAKDPGIAPQQRTPASPEANKSVPFSQLKTIPGYSQEVGAENAIGQARAQEGIAKSQLYQDAAATEQAKQQELKTHLDAKLKEIEAVTQDYKDGHIDPNHFLDSQSSGQKISTAIGLILGGIGGGITGQENPAMKFLNSQIERDLEAQKANLGKKASLLGALQNQYHDQQVAEDMFRSIRANILANQINQAAQKSSAKQAMPEAQKAIAGLMGKYYPMLQKSNAQSLANNPNGGQLDPASLVKFLVPEGQQKEVAKEIGDAQNLSRNKQAILDAFDKVKEQNTILGRVGRLGFEPPALKDFKALADPFFKDTEGRYNEKEAEHIYNLAHSPGSRESSDEQNRATLENWLERKTSAPLAKLNGIDLSKFQSTNGVPPQQTAELSYVQKNAQSPDPKVQARVQFIQKKYGRR